MESSAWPNKKPEDEVNPEGSEPQGFGLGMIYQREPLISEPAPLFQKREAVEPEVAEGVSAGETDAPAEPELPVIEQAAPEQQFPQYQPAEYVEAGQEKDDEDDEEEEAKDKKPVLAPLPVETVEPAPEPAEPLPVLNQRPEVTEQVVVPPLETVEAPMATQPAEIVAEPQPPVPPVELKPYAPQAEAEAPTPPAEEEPLPTLTAAGNRQPPPPAETFEPAPAEETPEEPAWHQTAQPVSQMYSKSQPNPNYNNLVTRDEFYRAHHDTRTEIVAATLTALLIGQYLDHRRAKKLRGQFDKQAALQNQKMNVLSTGQQDAEFRAAYQGDQLRRSIEAHQHAAVKPETPVRPPLQNAEQLQQAANPEQPWHLRPEEQLKRSAWHNIVVDEHGREVEGAIEYGEAFQQERLRERMPTPFGTQDARFQPGAQQQFQVPPGVQTGMPGPTLPSGQVPQGHSLPASDSRSYEPQRLLETEERNPLLATLTNPWLWLGVGVLMIVFFVAATI